VLEGALEVFAGRVKSVNGAGRRMRLGLLVAVGAAAPLVEVKVLKTRVGVEAAGTLLTLRECVAVTLGREVNGAGRRMRLGLLVAVGAAAPLVEVKVLKTRDVEAALPRLLGTGLEDGFCGGAAGRPLIGFRPSSAAEEGTYGAKTVDVATMLVTTVCLTVTVFWRGMTPATAGPARRAEIKMLESMSFGCCW
jgi:hypothetical protein